mmetsp:Transcript_92490/g.169980  ORF Transcript_92490/g.169980 Transcript_92490/m.169980 type:complete len:317 (+) Transcript_92490:79-1029(+)
MRTLMHLLCVCCSYAALRNVGGHRRDAPAHAVIEVDTMHFKVQKQAHNVSVPKETEDVAGVLRNVRKIAVASAWKEIGGDQNYSVSNETRSDAFMQRAIQSPSEHHEVVEHKAGSSEQHPGSAFQLVEVLTGSSKQQEQLLGVPSLAVVIPWPVAMIMFVLVACMSCACTALMFQGCLFRRKIRNFGVSDISGYEDSSSRGSGETEALDYSERSGPESTHVLTRQSELAGQKKKAPLEHVPSLDVYDYDIKAPTTLRESRGGSGSSEASRNPSTAHDGNESLKEVGRASEAEEDYSKQARESKSSRSSTEPITSVS